MLPSACIGRTVAGAGARVGVTGRTLETCEATVERIQATGSEGLAVSGDMTIEAEAERAVEETIGRFGHIDIIVNAVGGGAGQVLHEAEEYPRSDWDWVMELNGRSGESKVLVGPAIFLCSAAASFVTGQILGIDGGLTATQ